MSFSLIPLHGLASEATGTMSADIPIIETTPHSAISPGGGGAPNQSGKSLLGDANSDAHVNIFDFVLLMAHWDNSGSSLPEDCWGTIDQDHPSLISRDRLSLIG